jgi:PAS domain S-box-containing protein
MKRSLEGKVTLGFGTAVFALSVIGVLSYKSINHFITSAGWDDHTRIVLAKIAETSSEIALVESDARGYVITGDMRHVERYREAVNAVRPKVHELEVLTSDNIRQQERLKRLDPLINAKMAIMQRGVDLRMKNDYAEAQRLAQSGEGLQIMDELRGVLAEMQHEEQELLRERTATEQASASRTITIISFGSVFAFVLVGLAGWMIRRDFAARREAEHALRQSEEGYRFLADSMPQIIWSARADGGINYFNSRWQQYTGMSLDQSLDWGWKPVIHPTELQECVENWTASVRTGRLFEGEYRFRRASDGAYRWQLCRGLARLDAQGRIDQWVGTCTDINDQKRAEDSIKALNQSLSAHGAQLEAANKELEAFSYSVSHDLRAPLRSIDGFSQALLEDFGDKLGEEGSDSLQRVRAATQRMGQLIDDMLSLSRVTRDEMHPVAVDLTAMAQAVVLELQKGEPERRVTAVIPNGLKAHGDARLLRIVLDNLIGNAWKFTGRVDASRIEFGKTADGSFFVRDNGAGFDMTYSHKLFGAFQRLHAMKDFAGTGVGLATVQRIIERHGGRVRAEGAVGQGACFFFTVPFGETTLPLAA